MPPSRPSHLRKLLGLVGTSAIALVGSVVFATAASAHAPTFTATADCVGTVHFAATAWNEAGATDADRTHEDMAVKVSDDGHAWHDLPGTYAFNPANGFHFEGDYTPPAGWASIRIQAFSRSFAEASTDVLTVTAATGCTPATPPSASVADASCADQGAVVTLTNPGSSPVDFDVNGQTVTVPAGQTQTTTVTFPADTDTTVTVKAPGMADVTKVVDYSCGGVLSANIANATCADNGSVVNLVNTGGAPADFTISVPGQPDVTVTVPANGSSDQPITLPADVTSTVHVVSGGVTVLTKDVTYTCGSTPTTPETPSTPSTPEAPTVPGTPTTPSTPSVEVPVGGPATGEEVTPTPPTVPTTIPGQVLGESLTQGAPASAPAVGSSSGSLPFTGASTGPLALTGIGSLLAGLAMAFAGRRRTAQQ